MGEAGITSDTSGTSAGDAAADEPVAVEEAIAEEPEAAAAGALADSGADSGVALDETASAAGTIALVEDDESGKEERAAEPPDGVMVLGPAEAPLALVRGRYRFRLLVKTERNVDLQSYLRAWLARGPKVRGNVRVAIDVDPQSFL